MFLNLFYNVLSVFLMMLPGFVLMRTKVIRVDTLKDFSQIIVKVFYPLLIFSFIVSNFTIETILASWQLPFSVIIVMVAGSVIGVVYTSIIKQKDSRRKKSQLFQFTFNNYSFLPLAIIINIFDERYAAALLFSTLGAEVTIWTIGMFILNRNGKGFNPESLKHLLAPPLVGIYGSMFVLLLFHLFHTSLDELIGHVEPIKYLNSTIYQLGQATIPMSMLMVGGRIGVIKFQSLKAKDVWITTLFRLVIVPAACILILLNLFEGLQYLSVVLIVAVMPNSVASLVLGELYGADQDFMGGTVLITHIVSLLTIPLWLQFLSAYF